MRLLGRGCLVPSVGCIEGGTVAVDVVVRAVVLVVVVVVVAEVVDVGVVGIDIYVVGGQIGVPILGETLAGQSTVLALLVVSLTPDALPVLHTSFHHHSQ